jgi:hypothetical protein
MQKNKKSGAVDDNFEEDEYSLPKKNRSGILSKNNS